eukprot:EG_transcript_18550
MVGQSQGVVIFPGNSGRDWLQCLRGCGLPTDKVDFNRFAVVALQVVAPLEYWRGTGHPFSFSSLSDHRLGGFCLLSFHCIFFPAQTVKSGSLRNGGFLWNDEETIDQSIALLMLRF